MQAITIHVHWDRAVVCEALLYFLSPPTLCWRLFSGSCWLWWKAVLPAGSSGSAAGALEGSQQSEAHCPLLNWISVMRRKHIIAKSTDSAEVVIKEITARNGHVPKTWIRMIRRQMVKEVNSLPACQMLPEIQDCSHSTCLRFHQATLKLS